MRKIPIGHTKLSTWKDIARRFYVFASAEFTFTKLDPGQEEEWHYHRGCTEYIFVIKGLIIVEEDKWTEVVRKHDIVSLREGYTHRIRNPTKYTVEFLSIKPGYEAGDIYRIGRNVGFRGDE